MGCAQSKTGAAAARAAEERLGQRGRYLSFDSRCLAEWKAGDKNNDGVLSLKEVKKVLHKLNVAIPERELRLKFAEFDADGNGTLDFDEFQALFSAVQSLPDMQKVFERACASNEGMIAEELSRYLLSSSMSKVDLTLLECVELILKHEGASEREIKDFLDSDIDEESLQEGPVLTYEGFQRLLTDNEFNAIMDHQMHFQVYQDMTQPLSHYFISSSHNTYLTGNQMSSESSGTAVARALKLGVRVIELDAWDGSDGEPIVNHGHTMCKPVPMRECLKAIKECAFEASEYPVIITIENHCSLPQQKVQVDMLKSTFGDHLFQWPGHDDGSGKPDWTRGPDCWLSPEDLKGKIVIRDKPIKVKQNAKRASDGATEGIATVASDVGNSKLPEAPENTVVEPSSDIMSLSSLALNDEDDDDDEDVDTAKSLGVDDQLLKVMYIKNVKLKFTHEKASQRVDFKEPPFASSSSIVEGKMHKLTKAGYPMRDLCEYAQRHLVRVYPAGSRVDSSNYDPVSAWNAGCQLVALNYQTNSLPVWLNQGRFSDNGGCGYVLKPSFQLGDSFTPWDGLPKDVVCEMTVSVISGHYLPKPLGQSDSSEVIDPYVEVSLHGIEVDQRRYITRHIDDNGFNPSWNETFKFSVRQPELALLSFVVNDHDLVGKDDFIGQRVVPVTAIVPGYRMVQLYHKNGASQDSFLFVRIGFSPSPP
ncbi:1-phosphatidylinositol 4,5-bisphosphate phosphodiesterase 1 [Hondaea fermentalgiana]|uniref:Phosphoinositide phospholipase C n=1 Tax=Hondaea fermentalgiana TaxID=2315210 RepID=A0A2R5GVY5_9STRA|nr:1-phosphatidylinositol 4,5-bisphosphate phosphodiesterase 1 [Hondaea fermentalgiana]|eukprot:GBG32084.1 1-phosphatidylinositol 4,5-bisphosphate phosphodiesterase 1 [Hondaea fermentalgiana]